MSTLISPPQVDPVTVLGKALDAAVLRQRATAQNLANINTPGYRRLAVEFETQLSAVLKAGGAGGQLAAAVPRLVYADHTVGTVSTETELAQLSETVLHHHALVTALGKHMALMKSAVKEGKT